eukprot:gnl/MRDRNA2_/MRDRNA2_42204_c0_seq2.p2 gnl/MRDRNA2_/MRDRNA2_42204_c0~~gnl/MRDRNA2_/MRDRNA2_42204_c0_seq2.p2  ORF type:complete len:103 (-),score=21.50 gnl/MRDRNA2_/MRDRNA2_42204_c0_seq2:125-433(-)
MVFATAPAVPPDTKCSKGVKFFDFNLLAGSRTTSGPSGHRKGGTRSGSPCALAKMVLMKSLAANAQEDESGPFTNVSDAPLYKPRTNPSERKMDSKASLIEE